MKNTIIIAALFVCIISCKKKSENIKVKNTPHILNTELVEKPVLEITEQIKLEDSIKYIIIDDFANLPFGFKIKLNNIKKLFIDGNAVSIEKQSIINKHNDVLDTLYTYTLNKEKFILLKSRTDTFLKYANIEDNSIKLSKNISVGVTKDEFFKRFNEEYSTQNIIQIMDEEEYSNHLFYFNENKLIRIVINHNVD